MLPSTPRVGLASIELLFITPSLGACTG